MTYALPLVALGGALGASLRYLTLVLWPTPWAILAVNVSGSFAMGLLAVRLPPTVWPFLLTGLLGGFTTFSAFSLDTLRLLEGGRTGAAFIYMGGSVGLSLIACAAGLWLGRLI
jgi:CrcB protein